MRPNRHQLAATLSPKRLSAYFRARWIAVELPIGIIDRFQQPRKARGVTNRRGPVERWSKQSHVITREKPDSYDALYHCCQTRQPRTPAERFTSRSHFVMRLWLGVRST